ncbi:NFACT-R_1 domain-containing protein [Pseudoscourfieldia marina]
MLLPRSGSLSLRCRSGLPLRRCRALSLSLSPSAVSLRTGSFGGKDGIGGYDGTRRTFGSMRFWHVTHGVFLPTHGVCVSIPNLTRGSRRRGSSFVSAACLPTSLDATAETTVANLQAFADDVAIRLQGRREGLLKQQASAEDEGELRTRADLIMAFAHTYKPKQKQLKCLDFETGEEVLVDIDEEDGAIPTAEKLYKRAKQARKQTSKTEELLAKHEQDRARAEEVIRHVDELAKKASEMSDDDIERAAEAAMRAFAKLGYKPKAAKKKKQESAQSSGPSQSGAGGIGSNASGIRLFTSPAGLEILCGRNSQGNEDVSLRFSRQRPAVWFHVQGEAGAHVLLRHPANGDESAKPFSQSPDESTTVAVPRRAASKTTLAKLDAGGYPMEDVLAAASIAARYSKARRSTRVAVTCVMEPHRISKPSGARTGTVTIMPGTPTCTVHADPKTCVDLYGISEE